MSVATDAAFVGAHAAGPELATQGRSHSKINAMRHAESAPA